MIKKPFLTKTVLFDFDGTLTEPGALDFSAIKNAVGCPVGAPVLEYISTLPDPDERKSAYAVLERFETRAAEQSKPNAGAESLLAYLKSLGVSTWPDYQEQSKFHKDFNTKLSRHNSH